MAEEVVTRIIEPLEITAFKKNEPAWLLKKDIIFNLETGQEVYYTLLEVKVKSVGKKYVRLYECPAPSDKFASTSGIYFQPEKDERMLFADQSIAKSYQKMLNALLHSEPITKDLLLTR